MQGVGRKTMSDGSVVKGSFAANVVHGWAHKCFAFGDTYSGMYCRDARAGYGLYTWAGKETYDG